MAGGKGGPVHRRSALFLNDPGPSLQGALHILNIFSEVMGLWVNWTKSQLLPVDPEARLNAPPDIPLQWVDTFKYLGIVISRSVKD